MKNNKKAALKTAVCFGLAVLLAGCAGSRRQETSVRLTTSHNQIVGKAALQNRLTQILQDSVLTPAIVGLKVVNLETEEVLFQQYEKTLFNPASTMKMYTGAAALKYLGPEFRYETTLVIDSAAVVADTLHGDVYLVGSGDPSLKTAHFSEMIDALLSQGIRHVTGDLVCDDTFFDDLRYGEGWMWDDQPYYFVAPISALSVNLNVVEIYASPGDSIGAPAKLRMIPTNDFMTFENQSVTIDSATFKAAKEDSTQTMEPFNIMRRWRVQTNVVDVTGAIVEEGEEVVRVRNIVHPTLFAGTLFQKNAERAGITIGGKVIRGAVPENRRVLASHVSEQMGTLVANMNKPSDNVHAEALLKTVAAMQKGQPGTTTDGAEIIKEMLASWGLNPKAYRIADGSGVSSYTLLSPESMVTLLMEVYRDFEVRNEFVASLPIAGVDGSLRNRMKETAAHRIVRAKTGTISGVSTLGGYTTTQDGDVLAFSIMMAHFVGSSTSFRNIQDEICDALTRYISQSAQITKSR